MGLNPVNRGDLGIQNQMDNAPPAPSGGCLGGFSFTACLTSCIPCPSLSGAKNYIAARYEGAKTVLGNIFAGAKACVTPRVAEPIRTDSETAALEEHVNREAMAYGFRPLPNGQPVQTMTVNENRMSQDSNDSIYNLNALMIEPSDEPDVDITAKYYANKHTRAAKTQAADSIVQVASKTQTETAVTKPELEMDTVVGEGPPVLSTTHSAPVAETEHADQTEHTDQTEDADSTGSDAPVVAPITQGRSRLAQLREAYLAKAQTPADLSSVRQTATGISIQEFNAAKAAFQSKKP